MPRWLGEIVIELRTAIWYNVRRVTAFECRVLAGWRRPGGRRAVSARSGRCATAHLPHKVGKAEMKDKAKGPALAGLAVVLAAMVSGCATVNYSSPGALNGVAVEGSENAASGQAVAITTSGYYMFWTIPLVSGDLRWDTGSGEIRGKRCGAR